MGIFKSPDSPGKETTIVVFASDNGCSPLADFMATFAGITGYSVADNEAEDSFNLLPVLLNPDDKKTIREATVHHSIQIHYDRLIHVVHFPIAKKRSYIVDISLFL